jgi:hypothetical protein
MPPVISTSGGAHGACRGFLRRYHTDRQTRGWASARTVPQRVWLRAQGVPAIYPSRGT